MSKVIVVFGVDTPVGAVVANALLKASHIVKGVPLDGGIPVPENVELMVIDVNAQGDLIRPLQGCDACFIYTHSNFRYEDFMVKEQLIGYNIAEVCRKARVPHIVFCTQPHTGELERYPARHMVVKAEMELHFRAQNSPATYLELPCFYEDLFTHLAPIKEKERGVKSEQYRLEWPAFEGKSVDIPMMSLTDLGPVVEYIFKHSEDFRYKYIQLLGDRVKAGDVVRAINNEIPSVAFKEVPVDMTHHLYRDNDRSNYCPWNIDHVNMYKFYWRRHQKDAAKMDMAMDSTRNLYPEILTVEKWVRDNKPGLEFFFAESERIPSKERLQWWLSLIYEPRSYRKYYYYKY